MPHISIRHSIIFAFGPLFLEKRYHRSARESTNGPSEDHCFGRNDLAQAMLDCCAGELDYGLAGKVA